MSRMRGLLRFALVGALTLFVSTFAVPATGWAGAIQFDLTSDHCSGTGGCLGSTTRAGYITVTDVSSGVVDLLLRLENGNQLIDTGFVISLGYNLTGNPTVAYSSLQNLIDGGHTTAGSLHMNGAGFFEYGLDCACTGPGGSGPNSGPDFKVRIAGTGLSTASFTTNAGLQYFAVNILGNGNGGAVAAGSGTPIPEPSTIALYALGVAMLVAGQQWRKARASRII